MNIYKILLSCFVLFALLQQRIFADPSHAYYPHARQVIRDVIRERTPPPAEPIKPAKAQAATLPVTTQKNTMPYDQDITEIYRGLKSANIRSRIELISQRFLGRPYLLHALGEGSGGTFDQDPLYRLDVFDCETYVSTVLALAQAQNLAQFKQTINKVRYKNAHVSFVDRNHFTSVDWNTTNTYNGYLRDVTYQWIDAKGVPVARVARATIDKPSWFLHLNQEILKLNHPISPAEQTALLNELHALSKTVHAEESIVPYIPLTQLYTKAGNPKPEMFAQMPNGALIEVVRPNWDLTQTIGTHLNISHMGFAIRTGEGWVFREASSLKHKIIDVPLIPYLKHYLKSDTVKGINIQVISFPIL